ESATGRTAATARRSRRATGSPACSASDGPCTRNPDKENRMKLRTRMLVPAACALVFAGLVLARAQAGGSHYFPPVADPVVKEECGSCHLAFAPSMLPARSWERMMATLGEHFGDDATVEPAVAARIAKYLVDNA